MQNPQVHWSEGMFLRPHHFQASDRYWTELLYHQNQFDHPFGYGVSSISVQVESLLNGLLEIQGLRARLRDGSIIANAPSQMDRIDIKSRISPDQLGQPLDVYLAVPSYVEGLRNIDRPNESGNDGKGDRGTRFISTSIELPDENAGANRREIDLRRLRYHILFSAQDLSGYELLPLMRLLPSAATPGAYRLDETYYPPALTLGAWPHLEAIVRDLSNFIGAKLLTMKGIFRDQGISLASHNPGDMEKLWLVQALNQSYAELNCVQRSRGIHPLVAYLTLCSIFGRCSIFGIQSVAEEPPPYDHDDLGRIFQWMAENIRRLINSVKEDEVVQRFLIGLGPGMHVALEPDWLSPEWAWYFGVSPIGFTVQECFQLFKGGKMDIKLGASDKVEEYMEKRQPGLRFRGVNQTPQGIANRGKWLVFEIVTEGDAWRYVQLSQTLALRINKRQIVNLGTLEGKRRLQLSVEGQTYGLEFAVFAVKRRA